MSDDKSLPLPQPISEDLSGLIPIPAFLSTDTDDGISAAACAFYTEVACETDAMICGECSGQSCPGQCTSAECGQCGACQSSCQTTCQSSCQDACEGSCQNACESAAQHPTAYGSIQVTGRSARSVTLRLSAVAKADYYVVAYRPADTTAADTWRTTSLTVTITGLEPETEYAFNYYAGNSYGTGPYMPGPVYATTLSDRPNDWEWWSTVAKGAPIRVSASEWNAFCARINAFREYVGLARYGAFPTVRSGDAMTAAVFNHAVWAIGAMDSRAYSVEARAGDPITAKAFNDLKTYLNAL